MDKLPAFFPVLLFFPQALVALSIRLVLTLIDQFLNFVVFFLGVFLREGLVVFRNQLLNLFAIDLHHIEGLDVGGFHVPMAIQVSSFLTLDVGVVAQLFFIFHIVVGRLTNQLSNLIFGEGSGNRNSCTGRTGYCLGSRDWLKSRQCRGEKKKSRGLGLHIGLIW